jgi:hypothetical protein
MNLLSKKVLIGMLPLVTENLDGLEKSLIEYLKTIPVSDGQRAMPLIFPLKERIYISLAVFDRNGKLVEIREKQLLQKFITNLISEI